MSKYIDLSIGKASFFHNYDTNKTSYDYSELKKRIREAALLDIMNAIKNREGISAAIDMITDEDGGPEGYETPLTFLANIEELRYVKKSYIEHLVKIGRIGTLITDKEGRVTKKTKENGYKLGLLLSIENLIKDIEPTDKVNSDPFFKILLTYINSIGIWENRFAPSLSKNSEGYLSVLADKAQTYLNAEKAGPYQLDKDQEEEIKDKLYEFLKTIKAYVEKQDDYDYSYYNKDQAKRVYELTREDLDNLEI